MKCPSCGYDIGTAHKCLRCGCEIHSVATVDENKSDDPDIKVIDPSQVVLVETPIEEDDNPQYFDPLSSLFDSFFGDPINDILNMFGFGTRRSSTRRQQYGGGNDGNTRPRKDKRIYEFEDVEILDANDKPIYQSKKKKNKNDDK